MKEQQRGDISSLPSLTTPLKEAGELPATSSALHVNASALSLSLLLITRTFSFVLLPGLSILMDLLLSLTGVLVVSVSKW